MRVKTVQEERDELIIKSLRKEASEARNKAIDECIDAIFDKMIEVGPNKRFSYKDCQTILEKLKS